ncbi:MAG TPA: hypothetical protein VF250_14740 [Conexibacter sp.]
MRVLTAPAVIDPRSPTTLRYELELTTGDAEERFSVFVEPPLYGDGGVGLELVGAEPVQLEGPAQVVGGAEIFSDAACSTSPAHDVHHGAQARRMDLRIVAPPNTTSKLVATFVPFARDAPFIDMLLRPSFAFDRDRLTIAPAAPRVRGPHGVRILLTTVPGTAFFNPLRAPLVADGALVRVGGRTVPPVRGQTIRLADLPPPRGVRLTTVARVRTDARGRFHARWRPHDAGVHQLFAFYRSQQRGFTDDRTCPAFVRVRR